MSESAVCPRCGQEHDAAEPACPACGRLHAETPCDRHPERAADGACVLCGSPVCGVCDDGSRVHFSCPEHRTIPVLEGWAQVFMTGAELEASLIRDNLQSEGIDAEVLSQKDRSFTVELGDLSPVRVLVPAFRYQDARAVIEGHRDAAGAVRFACPACGEACDEGDLTCTACGQALT